MPRKRSLEDDLRELREERAEREKQGKLPREIERHHRFPPNEDPFDEDAHPDSGWLYANKGWDVTGLPPAGPPILGTSGPDSGMPCQVKGCNHQLRIIQEFRPGDILEFVEGNQHKRIVVKGDVGICILADPNGHQVQMRSDALPRRTSLILP